MSEETFLTPAEISVLTGIKIGRRIAGRVVHKEELQVSWLRTSGIPFYLNARGRPIVVRATLTTQQKAAPQPKRSWEPPLLRAA